MAGYIHEHGSFHEPVDYARAMQLYTRACSLEEPEGCGHLAEMYQEGEGVSRDSARAEEFSRLRDAHLRRALDRERSDELLQKSGRSLGLRYYRAREYALAMLDHGLSDRRRRDTGLQRRSSLDESVVALAQTRARTFLRWPP
jgi:TPR repeat protein